MTPFFGERIRDGGKKDAVTRPAQEWSKAKNILAVRLDSMGDVLMTGPALRALKEAVPDRFLTLLTSKSGGEAARLLSGIDRTMVYDAPWMKSSDACSSSQDLRMIETLRQKGFDGAVIFTVYSQNPLPAAMMCRLAGIPLRLAYCRENPYQLLSHWEKETEPEEQIRHEVRRQLDLVQSVGCSISDEAMHISIPPEVQQRVDKLLAMRGIRKGEPWVVIHPGASAPSRRYSPEGFAHAAGRLAREHQIQVVLTGDESERDLICSLQRLAGIRLVAFTGLELMELAAVLSRAPLLISNNTGPVHLAASVGTPVVDLYALTNPQHTPWAVPNRVLYRDVPCKYCYKSICPEGHQHCLSLVSADAVFDAAMELLGETSFTHAQQTFRDASTAQEIRRDFFDSTFPKAKGA